MWGDNIGYDIDYDLDAAVILEVLEDEVDRWDSDEARRQRVLNRWALAVLVAVFVAVTAWGVIAAGGPN